MEMRSGGRSRSVSVRNISSTVSKLVCVLLNGVAPLVEFDVAVFMRLCWAFTCFRCERLSAGVFSEMLEVIDQFLPGFVQRLVHQVLDDLTLALRQTRLAFNGIRRQHKRKSQGFEDAARQFHHRL